MNCFEARIYFDDYIANRLHTDNRNRLEKHLNNCPACKDELDQQKVLIDLLQMEKIPDPGEEYWNSLETNILSETINKSMADKKVPEYLILRPAKTIYKYIASLAAVFLIFVISVLGFTGEIGPSLSGRANEFNPIVTIADLESSPKLMGKLKSNLMGSIMLSPPGSFGRHGIILSQINNSMEGQE
jgi:hypothetical protein